jgi:hypothetical protein
MDATPITETAPNAAYAATEDEQLLIDAWCAEQLRCLGVPPALAETYAGLVDWHEIAALVGRGCPPELALEIAR